jgi:hypothetical protein
MNPVTSKTFIKIFFIVLYSFGKFLHNLSKYLVSKFPLFTAVKGPKHEIFERWVFTQIRPVRVGDLGNKQKTDKNI